MIGIVVIVIGIAGRLWSTLYIGGRKSAAVVSGGRIPSPATRSMSSRPSRRRALARRWVHHVAVGLALACAAAFHVVIMREEKYSQPILALITAPTCGGCRASSRSCRSTTRALRAASGPSRCMTTLLDGAGVPRRHAAVRDHRRGAALGRAASAVPAPIRRSRAASLPADRSRRRRTCRRRRPCRDGRVARRSGSSTGPSKPICAFSHSLMSPGMTVSGVSSSRLRQTASTGRCGPLLKRNVESGIFQVR